MEFIPFKRMPRDTVHFRNRGVISQREADFAEGAIFVTFSQPISQLQNGGTTLRNGTRVPKGHFAAAKIFAEEDRRLRNHFATGSDFRSNAWGLRNYFAANGHFPRGPF